VFKTENPHDGRKWSFASSKRIGGDVVTK